VILTVHRRYYVEIF